MDAALPPALQVPGPRRPEDGHGVTGGDLVAGLQGLQGLLVGHVKKPFFPSTNSLDNLEEVDELHMPNSSPLASLPSRSRPRSARFLRKKKYE